MHLPVFRINNLEFCVIHGGPHSVGLQLNGEGGGGGEGDWAGLGHAVRALECTIKNSK